MRKLARIATDGERLGITPDCVRVVEERIIRESFLYRLERRKDERRNMETTKNKSWRQPIPCAEELDSIFGSDYRAMQLYIQLVYRACNKDETLVQLEITVKGITRIKTAKLIRGQTLYGRHKFGQYLCWDDVTTDNALKRLVNIYEKVSIQRNHNWTIVTIHYYDDVVGMSKKRASDERVTSTSYSVKSVKSEKSEKNNGFVSEKENGSFGKQNYQKPSANTFAEEEVSGEGKTEYEEASSPYKEAINYYYGKYCAYTGEIHPRLSQEQTTRVVDELSRDFTEGEDIEGNVYDLTLDDWKSMIDYHFYRKLATDWNINHFATKGILYHLYLDAIYNGKPYGEGEVDEDNIPF